VVTQLMQLDALVIIAQWLQLSAITWFAQCT